MVEEGDKIDFDNMSERTFYSSEMEQGTLKKTGQHNQKWTYPDHVDERETLSCPSEQYIEIVYFNEGIGNGLEVECSTNRNECYLTGQTKNFRDARDQHRQYARRQIKTLTDTELKKFEEYYQRQEHAMHSKGILCQHNPSHKEIKLVGKNSDAVGETERQILTVIGRVTSQPFQKQSKPDSGRKKRMTPPSGSEVWKSSGGIQVFMYQGDLLNLDVDVIIHGTNSKLDNSRGLSAQISQAAGPELETACKTVYAERRLNVADACFTTAGNLHYRCVIHVVVPRWPEYKKSGTDQSTRRKLYHDDLGRAILNALDEACNIGAKSVALPAIGCAKCPSDIFPAAFGEALHCFLETDKVTPLRQIHVVDQSNQDILNKIKFELVRKSHSTDKQKSPEKFRDEAGAQHISGSKTHPSKWKKCSTTGRTCMLSPKLRVTIKEGKYIQTQASALVSIEDEDLQSARYVAKEIAKAAGDQYRKKMEQLRKMGIKYQISDVFDTYAGDIRNAKHVLHVIGPVADTDIVGNKDLFKALAGNIRACIFRVLNKVVEMELDSVALPSFTSGTFEQGQTEKVWELCVDVVKKYAADQSVKSSLKEIILVAGHHDVQLLLKLFESEMPHYGTVV
ncbi:protein mono-ADP-ribosyltransferase PARP14-like [Argopecten irradians]|uniref:protein mono-ADP-ribosyltransferase PARP14-like n=1 Tax=Argopecten irradians TaxID=31199 RepID=UPI003723C5AE